MLQSLFKYKSWSDNRLQSAIDDAKGIALTNVYDFTIRQLNHMVIVEELFRARLEDCIEPHQDTNTFNLPSLDDLFERLCESNKWYLIKATTIARPLLNKEVFFSFVDGKKGKMTIEEILIHVVNHGVYHRSAIGHAIEKAGFTRPADTYTMFLHATQQSRRKYAH